MREPNQPKLLNRRQAIGTFVAASAASLPRRLWAQTFPGSNGVLLPRPKVAIFFFRAAGVESGSIVDRWVDQEAAGLLLTPGLTALTVNAMDYERTKNAYAHTMTAPYDVIAELEFDGERSLDRWRSRWTGAATALTRADPFTLVTWQIVIRPIAAAERSGAKRIGIVGHNTQMTRDEFLRDWRDVHAPDVDYPKGLTGYILNFSDLMRSPAAPFDGYAELWWPDWQVQGVYQAERSAMRQTPGFFRDGPHSFIEERFHRELTPVAAAASAGVSR
jgi:hypothetical protein